MKKFSGITLSVIVSLWLAFAPTAQAANVNIDGLPAASSVAGANLFECEQGGINRRCTATQVAAFLYGLMSGDATANGTGGVTFATVNGNVGTFGSATQCATLTVNAKGLITAVSAATCTPAVGSVTGLGTGVATFLGTPSSANLLAAHTTKTGTGNAVFGSAPTIDSLNASTALTLAFLTGSTQCLHVNTSGVVSGTGSDCGAGGGSGITSLLPGAALVSSTTAACSQSSISTGGQTLSAAECSNAQVGTTYAIVDGDRGKLVTGTNSASQAYSIAQAGASTTFQSGWYVRVQNKGAGVLIITPATSTICGGSTLTIYPGQTQKITSDGTNYQCDAGASGAIVANAQTGTNYPFVSSNFGQLVNLSNASNQVPTIPQAGSAGFAAGWYVQACNQGAGTQTLTPATSTIGGAATFVLPAGTAAAPPCVGIVSDGTNYQVVPDFTRNGAVVIANGTAALGTGAIASGTCASVVTASAPGVATTDVLLAGFNGDPTAVTGYNPTATGMLAVLPYPTSGNANFKVCNNTSATITPGAITLNWRVER